MRGRRPEVRGATWHVTLKDVDSDGTIHQTYLTIRDPESLGLEPYGVVVKGYDAEAALPNEPVLVVVYPWRRVREARRVG